MGSYYGKGKIVIKNLDTGQTLVTEDLNFAKQHNNQGDNCCVKVYTFDDSRTHNGDRISAIVTGGGGSWETAPYDYKKNLRISMSLEEIGEDDYESNISNNNDTNDNNSNNDNDNIVSAEAICDSDDSTSAPSCDDFLKEQVKDNDHNDNNDNDYQEEFELPPEEEPEFEDEVTGNISSS